MTPEELEARADRARRRGELAEALALYQQLLALMPGDARISEKMALLSESLQPLELQSPKAALPVERDALPQSPQHEGERLFAIGDYAGAAAAYRRALADNPDNQLVRERLEELYRLAVVAAPKRSPTDAALPKDPQARLLALLDRIASRRRVRTNQGR